MTRHLPLISLQTQLELSRDWYEVRQILSRWERDGSPAIRELEDRVRLHTNFNWSRTTYLTRLLESMIPESDFHLYANWLRSEIYALGYGKKTLRPKVGTRLYSPPKA